MNNITRRRSTSSVTPSLGVVAGWACPHENRSVSDLPGHAKGRKICNNDGGWASRVSKGHETTRCRPCRLRPQEASSTNTALRTVRFIKLFSTAVPFLFLFALPASEVGRGGSPARVPRGKFSRKLGPPYFGVLIIRILLFWVLC